MKKKKSLLCLPLVVALLSGCNVLGVDLSALDPLNLYGKTKDFIGNVTDKTKELLGIETDKPDDNKTGGDEQEATRVSIESLNGIPQSVTQNSTLSTSGITASVKYSDGSTKTENVTRIELDTSVVSSSVTGKAYVGTIYKEFTISVTAQGQQQKTLSSITVSEQKTAYTEGDTFVAPTVTAHYSDGSTATVTATYSGYDLSTAGTQTVTVSYTEGSVTKTTTYSITVSQSQITGETSSYTFVNEKSANFTDVTQEKFLQALSLQGSEVITGYKDATNAYLGGNGGSGDTAWNLLNCLKVGKSSGQGKITLLLNGTTFSKIKVYAIGARDDGVLTINGITKDVTKKATAADLEPIVLDYNISGGITELAISSKEASSNNYAICITKIEFLGVPAPTPVPTVKSVSVTPSTKSLTINEEATLQASVEVENGAAQTVTWSSADSSKVSVDAATGKIKGLAVTTTPVLVTATSTADSTKSASCSVTVYDNQVTPAVLSVSLNETTKELNQGDTFTLVATVSTVGGAAETVTWASSDSSKVSVENGVITAVAETTEPVTITAKSTVDQTKFATCSVTVTKVSSDKVAGDFYKVASQDEITEGTYIIAYENDGVAKVFNGADEVSGFVSATPSEGHIQANDNFGKVAFESMEGGFALKLLDGSNAGKYMAGKSGSNTIVFSETKALNTIAHEEAGTDTIISNSTYLLFNAQGDQERFRYYKSITQQPVCLYKMAEGTTPTPVTLTSITADMTNKVYTEGDQLSLAGLTVTGHYSNGTEATITEGVTTSIEAGTVLALTDTSLTVSVGAITTTITLTINPKQEEGAVLTDISVTSNTHREFFVGDPFVGEQITATYDKGEPRVVTATYSGYDMSTAGTQTVTATYTENDVTKTATYDITVKVVPVLDGITITTQPSTTNYVTGQTFDPTGMVVTASYTGDKAPQAVTGYTFSTDALVAGTTSIEISYTEGGVTKTASVAITVTEPARATLPYTGTISGGVLPEGWDGSGYSAFSSTYVKLGEASNYIEAKKLFDAKTSIRVILDSYLNGTGKEPSKVTVYALNDNGETVDSETFSPAQISASSGQAMTDAGVAGRQSLMFEGAGITGVKIELTVRTANLVITGIQITDPPVMVSSVTLSESTMALEYPGSNGTLTATVSPDNAENSEIEWSVSEGSSVTVVNGVVTPIAVGQSTVTATAKDGSGKSASCVVTVSASVKVLESISVTTNPGKTEYESGETFNPTGMVVTANYEGGTSEPITDYTYSQDPLAAGTTSITISYGGKTTSVAITVTAAKGSTVDNPYTISEVIEACSSLGDNQWLPNRVYVTGEVKSYAPSSNNKYTLKDENGTEFIVYKSELPQFDRACIGDTVVMEGWVENFHNDSGNILEMTNYNDGTHNTLPTTASILSRGESDIVVDGSVEHATVDVVSKATNASTIEFSVTPDSGYQIGEVSYKVGQESKATVIEANQGTYSLKVLGKITIYVTTIGEGEKLPEVYKTATFAAANTSNSVNNYTSSATYTTNGFTVTTKNFNNNNKGWDMIKCGRKKPSSGSGASVATITTGLIDKEIVEIAIDFNTCTTTALNEAYILISANSDMSNATKVSFTVTGSSVVKVAIPEGQSITNGYYQIVFDCAEGSGNGFIAINSVTFNVIPD